MADVAASGGYYIAMGCERIVCDDLSITGSIGVVSAVLKIGELLEKVRSLRSLRRAAELLSLPCSALPLPALSLLARVALFFVLAGVFFFVVFSGYLSKFITSMYIVLFEVYTCMEYSCLSNSVCVCMIR